MSAFSRGQFFGRGRNRKRILDVIELSNGWLLLKTENRKSTRDFKVRTVYQRGPRIRSYTPKHAHFAIDFYGKLCRDRSKAMKLLDAIVNMWNRSETPNAIIEGYRNDLNDLPGYPLEYIIHALNWILEQEDANFTGRPPRRQEELDEVMKRFGIFTPRGREGSQLAVSHFCNIASGMHPVEALMRANLDILPIKRSRGSV